ncbi:MAG TPA: hypothetical protein VIT38_17405 [Allosphingosinicella sp.]|jgi:hypothetical protein
MEQQMEKETSGLSRRNIVLALGGAVAVAGALVASPLRKMAARRSTNLAPTRNWGSRLVSLGSAGVDEWSQQVGSVFTVAGGTAMRLAGVRAMPAPGGRPSNLSRSTAFLAVFDPLNGATMAGNLTYGASHPEYGALMMFLTESSDPATPSRMFAVFN